MLREAPSTELELQPFFPYLTGSYYNLGWPGSYWVALASLELVLPTSAFGVLGLWVDPPWLFER